MEQFVESYNEVEAYYDTRVRNIFRHLTLNNLSLFTELTSKSYLNRPRIQFLYFHHVFQDEAENFEKLVQHLARGHTFISHTEAVERLISGDIDKAYISWSSDDGLENNTVAAEILERYGAKCCFFINPKSIGMTNFEQVRDFCANKLFMPPVRFLDWSGVEKLLKAGHEIGSHTMNHDRVTDLSDEQFRKDLQESKDILEKFCGQIKHFAYTYGRFTDFSAKAHKQVFEAGFESCATAVRGCHVAHNGLLRPEDLFIRRDLVIGKWPIAHMRYFIMKSSQKARPENNLLPNTYLK